MFGSIGDSISNIAGGSMFGSLLGGGGGSFSTGTLERATDKISDIYKEQLDLAGERGQPFLDLGTGTAGMLGNYLGVSGDEDSGVYGSLLQRYSPDAFYEDPSYQFRLDEGLKGTERALAAQGKTLSPEAVSALNERAQNIAATEYGDAFDRYRAEQGDIYGRLLGTTGLGQTEAARQSGYGMNYAGGMGDLYASLASAQQQAKSAQAAADSQQQSDMMNAAITAGMMAFSDERTKENVVKVGEKNGHNIYEYNYKNDPKRYRGVMAQEVLKKQPDAVKITDNGIMIVDYGKVGVEMEEV